MEPRWQERKNEFYFISFNVENHWRIYTTIYPTSSPRLCNAVSETIFSYHWKRIFSRWCFEISKFDKKKYMYVHFSGTVMQLAAESAQTSSKCSPVALSIFFFHFSFVAEADDGDGNVRKIFQPNSSGYYVCTVHRCVVVVYENEWHISEPLWRQKYACILA